MNVHKYEFAQKCVADAKYEEKNLSSLGKCVTYEARSEKRENFIIGQKA